uniref:Eukaryotic translation initiation factor 4 gamma 2 n=1 Tax=Corethrella appendiculata TaxID=1370023 RepID=U5EPX1_9DIPT
MYAQLCKRIKEELDSLDNENKANAFTSAIVNVCRDKFVNRVQYTEQIINSESVITDDVEEKKNVAKQRILGNIKFTGELYKLDMLPEVHLHNLLQEIIKKKYKTNESSCEDMEYLAQLIKTCGKNMDTELGKQLMDQYFDRMEQLSQSNMYPPRIRFLLRDVIELRKNNWKPRQVARVEGPAPIQEFDDDIIRPSRMNDYRNQDRGDQRDWISKFSLNFQNFNDSFSALGVTSPAPLIPSYNSPQTNYNNRDHRDSMNQNSGGNYRLHNNQRNNQNQQNNYNNNMRYNKHNNNLNNNSHNNQSSYGTNSMLNNKDLAPRFKRNLVTTQGLGVDDLQMRPTPNSLLFKANMNIKTQLPLTHLPPSSSSSSTSSANNNNNSQSSASHLNNEYPTPAMSKSGSGGRNINSNYHQQEQQQHHHHHQQYNQQNSQNSSPHNQNHHYQQQQKQYNQQYHSNNSGHQQQNHYSQQQQHHHQQQSHHHHPHHNQQQNSKNNLHQSNSLNGNKSGGGNLIGQSGGSISLNNNANTNVGTTPINNILQKEQIPIKQASVEKSNKQNKKDKGPSKDEYMKKVTIFIQEILLDNLQKQITADKQKQEESKLNEKNKIVTENVIVVDVDGKIDEITEEEITDETIIGKSKEERRSSVNEKETIDTIVENNEETKIPTSNDDGEFKDVVVVLVDKKPEQEQLLTNDEYILNQQQTNDETNNKKKQELKLIEKNNKNNLSNDDDNDSLSSGGGNVVGIGGNIDTNLTDENKLMKELIAEFYELKVPDKFMKDSIIKILNEILDKSDRYHDKIIDFLLRLRKDNRLANNAMLESFKSVVNGMSEKEKTIPKITTIIASILSRSVSVKLCKLSDISNYTENGQHYPLFLLVLQQLHKTNGKQKLQELFNQSKINLMTSLPECDRTKDRMAEILDDRSLSFLYPLLRVQAELWKQIQFDSNPQHIYKWIKENVDSSCYTDPGFITAIMTVLLKFITHESSKIKNEKQSLERETEILEKYCPVLNAFLNGKIDLQLIAIYAMQVHWYSIEYPKGVLLRWFRALYDLNVIEEEAFLRYKEDVTDIYPGKGIALFQVNQWLTWLAEAEDEDEDDEE